MSRDQTQIRIKGKTVEVPSTQIEGRTVVVTGKGLKIASIKDEGVVEGEPVPNPEKFIGELQQAGLRMDIFSFAQRIPDFTPKFRYRFEWDNVAAIPISSFEDWWTNRLPQESRK